MAKIAFCLILLFAAAHTYSIINDQPCPSIIGCQICDNPDSG